MIVEYLELGKKFLDLVFVQIKESKNSALQSVPTMLKIFLTIFRKKKLSLSLLYLFIGFFQFTFPFFLDKTVLPHLQIELKST